MVMGESRGGYSPLAEGLGDVPPGTKPQRVGGREQGVLLFEIVNNSRVHLRITSSTAGQSPVLVTGDEQ